MYYKKLLKRNKLIKFWIFFGGNYSYKLNYKFLTIFYNNSYYFNIKYLFDSIKKVLPIFLNNSSVKSKFLCFNKQNFFLKFFYYLGWYIRILLSLKRIYNTPYIFLMNSYI